MEWQTNTQGLITNYLDDFLFLTLTLLRCNALIQHFLNLCKDLGVPVLLEKTEWGNDIVTFLGILLNGRDFSLGVPLEKQKHAEHLGFGCLLRNKWIQAFWNDGFPNFVITQEPSIEYLELYALVAGVLPGLMTVKWSIPELYFLQTTRL